MRTIILILLLTGCGPVSQQSAFADRESDILLNEINTITQLSLSEQWEVKNALRENLERIYRDMQPE